jgi:hypothetical protein
MKKWHQKKSPTCRTLVNSNVGAHRAYLIRRPDWWSITKKRCAPLSCLSASRAAISNAVLCRDKKSPFDLRNSFVFVYKTPSSIVLLTISDDWSEV